MTVLLVCCCSYLLGAVPFSNIAATRRAQVDLRRVGSGTVSGTSLYQVAGFGPLAIAGSLDVAKGAVGPLLLHGRPAAMAVAGGLAVVGHNWSVFLGGHGGRGLSTAIGALLVLDWPGAVILLVGMIVGRLTRASGFVVWLAQCSLLPALAALSGASGAWAATCVVTPMWVKRLTGNAPVTPGSRGRILASRFFLDRDDGRLTDRRAEHEPSAA